MNGNEYAITEDDWFVHAAGSVLTLNVHPRWIFITAVYYYNYCSYASKERQFIFIFFNVLGAGYKA